MYVDPAAAQITACLILPPHRQLTTAPLLLPRPLRGFTMDCGTKHYKHLMAHFNIVVDVFLRLDRPFQDAIADITKRMGAGMAKFIQKEVRREASSWGMPLI